MIRPSGTGTEVAVRVIPRAKRTSLSGTREDCLLIRLAAPPVDGAANDALIAFFADLLGIPKRAVRVTHGERSRRKRVTIDGIAPDRVKTALGL